MNQAEFEKAIYDRVSQDGTVPTSNLETWMTVSDTLIAESNGDGSVVPDGGEWKGPDGVGSGIFPWAPNIRATVRNYCAWLEVTLPGGATGINVSAHAPNADRFL